MPETQETVRCPKCELIQFWIVNKKCRKCRADLDPKPLPAAKPKPVIKPATERSIAVDIPFSKFYPQPKPSQRPKSKILFSFGEAIQIFCAKENITLEELRKRTGGLSSQLLRRIVVDTRHPSYHVRIRIVHAFNRTELEFRKEANAFPLPAMAPLWAFISEMRKRAGYTLFTFSIKIDVPAPILHDLEGGLLDETPFPGVYRKIAKLFRMTLYDLFTMNPNP